MFSRCAAAFRCCTRSTAYVGSPVGMPLLMLMPLLPMLFSARYYCHYALLLPLFSDVTHADALMLRVSTALLLIRQLRCAD